MMGERVMETVRSCVRMRGCDGRSGAMDEVCMHNTECEQDACYDAIG